MSNISYSSGKTSVSRTGFFGEISHYRTTTIDKKKTEKSKVYIYNIIGTYTTKITIQYLLVI